MNRFPVIITIGAALLGWVAGEMAISDPAVKDWIDAQMPYLHYVAPALGAAGVVALGKFLAGRAEAKALAEAQAETPTALARSDVGVRRILLAVDGSEHSRKAVEQVLALGKESRDPRSMEIHLANVQPGLPGEVAGFVSKDRVKGFHHEHADTALKTAREMLAAGRAGLQGTRGGGPCRAGHRGDGQQGGLRAHRDGHARPGRAFRGAARLGGAEHAGACQGAGAAGEVGVAAVKKTPATRPALFIGAPSRALLRDAPARCPGRWRRRRESASGGPPAGAGVAWLRRACSSAALRASMATSSVPSCTFMRCTITSSGALAIIVSTVPRGAVDHSGCSSENRSRAQRWRYCSRPALLTKRPTWRDSFGAQATSTTRPASARLDQRLQRHARRRSVVDEQGDGSHGRILHGIGPSHCAIADDAWNYAGCAGRRCGPIAPEGE